MTTEQTSSDEDGKMQLKAPGKASKLTSRCDYLVQDKQNI